MDWLILNEWNDLKANIPTTARTIDRALLDRTILIGNYLARVSIKGFVLVLTDERDFNLR